LPALAKPHELEAELSRVDWNFSGVSTRDSSLHSLHWFPGNFIPQIPAFLTELLTAPGDLVVDPFCGSGTTGVEAVLLGRRSYQSDVCRASVQVARGKLCGARSGDSAPILAAMADRLVWDSLLRSERFGADGEGSHPELRTWLHVDTHAQLAYLWTELVERAGNLRPLLEMLFTDVLFACASAGASLTRTGKRRRHHWGWVADNVPPRKLLPHNAVELFRRRLQSASASVARLRGLEVRAACDCADARALPLRAGAADAIITSPPYLGMIDYTLSSRLTYLWMGWSLEGDFAREIGPRRRRNAGDAQNKYLESMTRVAGAISLCLREGGYCAIVLGTSRKHPGVDRAVFDIFERSLTRVWGPAARTPTRRRVSERAGGAPTESLCVFQK